MKVLFLDDIRLPKNVFGDNFVQYNQITWVQNYNEFVMAIENDIKQFNTLSFQYIQLDHDLGEEKTGYDCVKWLCDKCDELLIRFPKYHVHSANPIGKENIEKYIENFEKHRITN